MRADATIREVQPGDASALAMLMRQSDQDEALAATGRGPLQSLLDSIDSSEVTFAAEAGGDLLAIGGVCDGDRRTLLGDPDFHVLWLLTSENVDRHKVAFWRASQRVVGSLLERHPVLANMIDDRYGAAIRWAARLGAEIGPPVPWGASGMLFRPAIWRAPWA